MRTRPAALGAVLFIAALGVAPPTHAQSNKISAEALFDEGRKLVADGKLEEACPKFESSQRLDPSPGTLLNLASCYEKLEKNASAWATYKEAASLASATGRADLLAAAQRHAERIAPKLSRLTIAPTSPAPGLELKRDGHVLAPAEHNAPIPIDKGRHTIEASAPGKKPWGGTIDIAEAGATVSVPVPALEDAPIESKAKTATGADAAPAQERTGLGTQRVIAIAVGGAGIIGLGVGTAFTVMARSRYDESLADCSPADRNRCTAAGVSRRDDARSAGNVASIALAAGGVAVVGGALLWIFAPKENAEKPVTSGKSASGFRWHVTPTLGGTSVQGEF